MTQTSLQLKSQQFFSVLNFFSFLATLRQRGEERERERERDRDKKGKKKKSWQISRAVAMQLACMLCTCSFKSRPVESWMICDTQGLLVFFKQVQSISQSKQINNPAESSDQIRSAWLCCHIVLLAPPGGTPGNMHSEPELPALHRDPGTMQLLPAPVTVLVLVLVLETVVNWWQSVNNKHSSVHSVNVYLTWGGETSSFGCCRRDARMEGGQLRVDLQKDQRRSFHEGGVK